ncbi:serine/threonine-protein kinase SBK2 [Podarcis raffonei]|uniref:serine/threonine-protein kinase SBK2 n=1 Tax=Podarcis raffonei TaxID=65483 RepID=UPI0023294661|nr:serine/threonine-protein kinase SBK2 [Podarcis raffonei]
MPGRHPGCTLDSFTRQQQKQASERERERLGTPEILQHSRNLVMDLSSGMEAQALLEDMLEITAQSLVHMEVSEHYHIIKELGKGKYGQVVLVTHRKRGTPMALKLLPKASTKLENFLYEYCVALSLSTHPAIVGMFGIAIESSQHYGFLYEAALHKDLISIIKPKAGIPEPAAKLCAKQLVSALDFIHSRGLVYRDVKPENILLFDRHCHCIKLTDFGLTRPQGTLLRLVVGIIPYTAPELSRGTGDSPGLPIDASLDAWALGVLIFCLLTGYFPWEKTLPEDSFFDDFVIWQQSGLDEDLPYHWRPLSPDAVAMLRSLLALEPTKRGPIRRVLSYLDRPWRAEVAAKDP